MNLKFWQYVFIMIFTFTVVGCGADSDFLRDTTADTTTNDNSNISLGQAHEQLENGLYQYEWVNEHQLGFNYIGIDPECTADICSLVKKKYLFVDNNVTEYKDKVSSLVLSEHGWVRKSSEEECNIVFSNNTLERTCQDGHYENILLEETTLEGEQFFDLYPDVILESMIKDNYATFDHRALKVLLTASTQNELNSTARYFIDPEEAPTVYRDANQIAEATQREWESYSQLNVKLNGYTLIVNRADLESGLFDVYYDDVNVSADYTELRWHKEIVYENYRVLIFSFDTLLKEHTDVKDVPFISYYDGSLRCGASKSNNTVSDVYLDKVAFNTIYEQLMDDYIGKSEVSALFDNGLYQVDSDTGDGYNVLTLSADKRELFIERKQFYGSATDVTWFLSDQGLKRESNSCEMNLYKESYDYRCLDGRKAYVACSTPKKVPEEFIAQYLVDNNSGLTLADNTAFFSYEARVLSCNQEMLADIYRFNFEESLAVGKRYDSEDAELLFSISNKEKDLYIQSMSSTDNGNLAISDLEPNSIGSVVYRSGPMALSITGSWRSFSYGNLGIVEVVVPTEVQSEFNDQEVLFLIEMEVSPGVTKVVTGSKIMQQGSQENINFLNYHGFKDLENTINAQ